jgi:hypothetical protein
MFQDNPLSGVLFLAAIGWGAYAANAFHIAIAALLALIVATLTAKWLRVDEASLNAGLYGFNGILVGLALATFLAPGPLLWVYVILGAVVSVVVMLGTATSLSLGAARSRSHSSLRHGSSCWPRMAFLASRGPRYPRAMLSPHSSLMMQARSG